MDPYSGRHQELDSVMGTATRIPRLTSADGFSEWKFRIESYIKMANPKVWRCMIRGPIRITETNETTGVVTTKDMQNYTDEEWEKVQKYKKIRN